MKDSKKLPKKQEQKDLQPQQHTNQQQKNKQVQAPKKADKQQVFHEQERIETRMTR
jgi:hypothetical protein